MTPKQLARWKIAWRQLAHMGQCDEYGGREYKRLLRVWDGKGRIPQIRLFIALRANEFVSPNQAS